MINSFTHYLKTTIEFGNGKRFEIKNLIEEKNAKKVLLVCDPTVYKLGIANDIIASVEEAGASAVAFTEVEPDPRVADMRAPTPSAAAELAVPDANELQYALSALKNRMFLNVSSGIADRRSRLEYLTSKGALKSPDEMLSNRSQRLDTAFSKMLSSYENRIGGKKVEFISAATALSKLDPMSVLMRGFAFVSDKNGKNVYSSQALAKGDKINVRFHDGSAVCEVKEITQ